MKTKLFNLRVSCQYLIYLSYYLKEKYGRADRWEVHTIPHARQQDSISCGVFCLKVSILNGIVYKTFTFPILDSP